MTVNTNKFRNNVNRRHHCQKHTKQEIVGFETVRNQVAAIHLERPVSRLPIRVKIKPTASMI